MKILLNLCNPLHLNAVPEAAGWWTDDPLSNELLEVLVQELTEWMSMQDHNYLPLPHSSMALCVSARSYGVFFCSDANSLERRGKMSCFGHYLFFLCLLLLSGERGGTTLSVSLPAVRSVTSTMLCLSSPHGIGKWVVTAKPWCKGPI